MGGDVLTTSCITVLTGRRGKARPTIRKRKSLAALGFESNILYLGERLNKEKEQKAISRSEILGGKFAAAAVSYCSVGVSVAALLCRRRCRDRLALVLLCRRRCRGRLALVLLCRCRCRCRCRRLCLALLCRCCCRRRL